MSPVDAASRPCIHRKDGHLRQARAGAAELRHEQITSNLSSSS